MLAALVTAGCSSVTGGGQAEPDAAVLEFFGDPVQVTVPEAATAGEAFPVTIRTYGGGCVRQGTTEVSVEGSTARLRPRDLHKQSAVCTAELRVFTHQVSVRFAEPGSATLHVYGVRITRGGEEEPMVVTRTVLVRRPTETQ